MAEYKGGPYATKAEIRQIWARCGDILHRGTLKRLIKVKNPVQNNFAELNEWGQKLLNLLSNHRIISLDGDTTFIAILGQAEDVQVAIGVAVPS